MMDEADIVDIGVKRKDLYPSGDKVSGPSEDEKVYPSFTVEGKQAELMGAEDLSQGDVVIVPVKLRVDSITKGKNHTSVTLCICGMGDKMEEAGDDSEDSSDSEDSPVNALRSGWGE